MQRLGREKATDSLIFLDWQRLFPYLPSLSLKPIANKQSITDRQHQIAQLIEKSSHSKTEILPFLQK